MGDAFLIKRGGGGKLFAAISVTYPSGSTCTCTNGSKTLTAKGTGGSYVFYVPEAGTWTVSCTDGTSTASKSVVISNEYQSELVDLSYNIILIDGVSYKSGVILDGGLSITTGTNTTNFSRSGTGYGYAYWRNIDLTGRTKFIADMTISPAASPIGTRAIRVWQNNVNPTHENSIASQSMVNSGMVQLDLSLSGIYTVGFSVEYSNVYAFSDLHFE